MAVALGYARYLDIREIQEQTERKSAFLASMSHELRTPMNAIIGFTRMVMRRAGDVLPERQKQNLEKVTQSADHLLVLINSILDLSKIEAGKLEVELAPVDLRALLEGSVVVVRERALAHNITLSLDMSEDVGTIVADERKIKQIMFNLLSNAIKFTADRGKAGIRARRSDGFIEVAVWDTGVGIAAEDQQRIFEEFQQAEQGLTDKSEGTGLGLALTRKLVTLHGGKLWVESSQNSGSTFSFTLPVDRGRAPGDAIPASKA